MQDDDLQALRKAVAALEHPGLAARLAEIAGKPIELFNRALPETASKTIAAAAAQALRAKFGFGGRSFAPMDQRLRTHALYLNVDRWID